MKKTVTAGLKTVLFLTLILSVSWAKEDVKPNNSKQYNKIEIIEMASKQRMLSQTIAKDYFYIGKNIGISKAKRQMAKSLKEFANTQQKLSSSIEDEEIKNLLAFVEMSNEDFMKTLKNKFNLDDAQLVLDFSETLLEGNQYIIESIKESIDKKEQVSKEKSILIERATNQRVLAQRIAKYYISYQSGIKDKNTIHQMQTAVKEFNKVHKMLISNKINTDLINKKLHQIDRLWRIVYKFYLNIEKGRLPYIVFVTTNDITKKMSDVTQMYLDLNKQ
jgi:predicted amino acid-binding ACT domain protein